MQTGTPSQVPLVNVLIVKKNSAPEGVGPLYSHILLSGGGEQSLIIREGGNNKV